MSSGVIASLLSSPSFISLSAGPFEKFPKVPGLLREAGDIFYDPRTGRDSRHGLVAQFRQSVFKRLTV